MRFGDVLLAVVLGALTLVVALVGPGWLTQTVLERLGWSPYVEEQEPERRATPSLRSRERKLALSISEADVGETLSHFASLRSRVVGYPGSEEAYRYVKEEFEHIGLEDVTVETFPVVVPVDLGAGLEVLDTGELVPLYCLWPNQVKPPSLPPEGVEGPLIYGGKGTFRELDGKEVRGEHSVVGLRMQPKLSKRTDLRREGRDLLRQRRGDEGTGGREVPQGPCGRPQVLGRRGRSGETVGARPEGSSGQAKGFYALGGGGGQERLRIPVRLGRADASRGAQATDQVEGSGAFSN